MLGARRCCAPDCTERAPLAPSATELWPLVTVVAREETDAPEPRCPELRGEVACIRSTALHVSSLLVDADTDDVETERAGECPPALDVVVFAAGRRGIGPVDTERLEFETEEETDEPRRRESELTLAEDEGKMRPRAGGDARAG